MHFERMRSYGGGANPRLSFFLSAACDLSFGSALMSLPCPVHDGRSTRSAGSRRFEHGVLA
jgi:hypothetical protein